MNDFDRLLAPLGHALDVSMLRFHAIRSNLAHVNTPGYRRLEVKFESLLADRLRSGPVSGEALRAVEPRVVRDESPGRPDGNNVTLEREMADHDRARLQYETLLEIASLRIQGLRSAIASR
jgi:flagellar basal-body rod protein FlgB